MTDHEYEKPKKKAKAPSAPKASVMDHFKATKTPLWAHSAASALHGWALYEHNQNEPFSCSEDDYRAALEAAQAPNPTPHKGASAL